MRALMGLVLPVVFAWSALGEGFPPPERPLDAEDARVAVERAEGYLLETQNPDGSWGGSWDSVTTWSGPVWSNPESHRSWRVATTGLCCLALVSVEDSPEVRAALDRSIDYLVENDMVKRPSEWDTMNCWAHIYSVQGLAAVYVDPRFTQSRKRAAIRKAVENNLKQLRYHQSLSGGWGYLEFDRPRTNRPQWATSFTTAAGVIALVEAREAGFDVDEGMLRRAVKAVRRCWLPNGAYTYSVRVIPNPRSIGSINRIKGSLSRIQVCNLALLMGGDEIGRDRLRTGIEQFFEHHRFLDIALHKPIPHETYYQNSGYFYMFGHYYAARVIALLPEDEQKRWWPKLWYEVAKLQRENGSIWDYDMHAYDRAYGSAYGILALQSSLVRGATGARLGGGLTGRATTQPAARPTTQPRGEREAGASGVSGG